MITFYILGPTKGWYLIWLYVFYFTRVNTPHIFAHSLSHSELIIHLILFQTTYILHNLKGTYNGSRRILLTRYSRWCVRYVRMYVCTCWHCILFVSSFSKSITFIYFFPFFFFSTASVQRSSCYNPLVSSIQLFNCFQFCHLSLFCHFTFFTSYFCHQNALKLI